MNSLNAMLIYHKTDLTTIAPALNQVIIHQAYRLHVRIHNNGTNK